MVAAVNLVERAAPPIALGGIAAGVSELRADARLNGRLVDRPPGNVCAPRCQHAVASVSTPFPSDQDLVIQAARSFALYVNTTDIQVALPNVASLAHHVQLRS